MTTAPGATRVVMGAAVLHSPAQRTLTAKTTRSARLAAVAYVPSIRIAQVIRSASLDHAGRLLPTLNAPRTRIAPGVACVGVAAVVTAFRTRTA